ncbi:MAG TPA: hypothetical protein VIZ90_08180 [Rhizobiaceae bacterium]
MNMSERFETRGEIGQSIAGVRDQLALQAKVFTVAVGLSVIVLGFLYYQNTSLTAKYAALQEAQVRIQTQLEAAIAEVGKVKVDTEQSRVDAQELKTLLEAALKPPGAPASASFPGWLGIKADGPKEAKALIDQYKTPVWIYATSPTE